MKDWVTLFSFQLIFLIQFYQSFIKLSQNTEYSSRSSNFLNQIKDQ